MARCLGPGLRTRRGRPDLQHRWLAQQLRRPAVRRRRDARLAATHRRPHPVHRPRARLRGRLGHRPGAVRRGAQGRRVPRHRRLQPGGGTDQPPPGRPAAGLVRASAGQRPARGDAGQFRHRGHQFGGAVLPQRRLSAVGAGLGHPGRDRRPHLRRRRARPGAARGIPCRRGQLPGLVQPVARRAAAARAARPALGTRAGAGARVLRQPAGAVPADLAR